MRGGGRLPDWWRGKPEHFPGQEGGTVTEVPATSPAPPPRPRDWLDDILDSNATTDPCDDQAPEPTPPDDGPTPADDDPTPPNRRTPRLLELGRRQPPAGNEASTADRHPATVLPRSSLLDALDGVPPRVRRLIANSTAAYLGWTVGLLDFTEEVVAGVHAEGPADPQSVFWYLVGLACLALYRRSRAWWWPVAWLASVPAATAVAGVLLYAPTS